MVQDMSPVLLTVTTTWVPEPLVTVRHLRLAVEPVEDQSLE